MFCTYIDVLLQCNGYATGGGIILQEYFAQTSTSGLSLVPKLTYQHIKLTSFSKMRVDLAVQVCIVVCMCGQFSTWCVCFLKVLSDSVSKAIELRL